MPDDSDTAAFAGSRYACKSIRKLGGGDESCFELDLVNKTATQKELNAGGSAVSDGVRRPR